MEKWLTVTRKNFLKTAHYEKCESARPLQHAIPSFWDSWDICPRGHKDSAKGDCVLLFSFAQSHTYPRQLVCSRRWTVLDLVADCLMAPPNPVWQQDFIEGLISLWPKPHSQHSSSRDDAGQITLTNFMFLFEGHETQQDSFKKCCVQVQRQERRRDAVTNTGRKLRLSLPWFHIPQRMTGECNWLWRSAIAKRQVYCFSLWPFRNKDDFLSQLMSLTEWGGAGNFSWPVTEVQNEKNW